MKFIPDSLKRMFSRKGKKDASAPAASAEEATAPAPLETAPVPEKAAPQRTEPTGIQRANLEGLQLSRQPEGYYLIDMDITTPGVPFNGAQLHMVKSYDADMYLAIMGPSFLTGSKALATEIEKNMRENYGMDVGHIFFKARDQDFYVDGDDEILGLPPGNTFQMVVIPQGVDWAPQNVAPTQYAIPGTGTVLQHPASVLPQYARPQPWKLLMINGYNVLTPELPDIPQSEPLRQPMAEPVALPASLAAAGPAPGPTNNEPVPLVLPPKRTSGPATS